jgi:hypothetical protein
MAIAFERLLAGRPGSTAAHIACAEDVIPFLKCPHCSLIVALRGAEAPIEHCPRCLARRRKVGMLLSTQLPDKTRSARPASEASTSSLASSAEGER